MIGVKGRNRVFSISYKSSALLQRERGEPAQLLLQGVPISHKRMALLQQQGERDYRLDAVLFSQAERSIALLQLPRRETHPHDGLRSAISIGLKNVALLQPLWGKAGPWKQYPFP